MAADLAQLLLPLLVVVGGATLFRAAFERFRQPAVLGEIVFGILLGASFLGWLWPAGEQALFAKDAMPTLSALSWIGLALFMFTVGTELRWKRGDGSTTAKLAYGALVLPFTLGVLLAVAKPAWFFDGQATLQQLALVAVVLCVSALPVLARLLEHYGLMHQRLGSLILGAGTIDDVFAWSLLAFILSAAGVGLTGNFGLNVVLVLGLFAVALAADRVLTRYFATRPFEPGQATLAALVCAILGSAWLTQAAGLHALIGPLLVGALVSRHEAVQAYARSRLQGLTMVLFLPVFFVLTGLDTNLTLLASSTGALAFVVVLAAASLGKLAGCWLGGRAAGLNRQGRLAAGLLLNARGAVGLVVAKLGYDAGLLSPRGFALLALVIVVTTCAAAPLLELCLRWGARAPAKVSVPTHAPLLSPRVHAK